VAALVVAAFMPYLASLTFDYVLDDRLIVRQNEAIRGWSSLLTLWTKPYWITAAGEPGQGLYRPVFMVILSVLWNTGLRYPIFFHLLAIVAHAVATVLVFRLMRRVFWMPAAAVGALWFAVHPVHVEAVSNIANSSEVFVTVATLALALLLLRADERVDANGVVPWATAIGGAALWAAAVLTKESGVTAPALALIAVWGWRAAGAPTSEPWRASVRSAWTRWRPLVAACAVVVVLVVVARMAVLQSLVSRDSIAAEGLGSLTSWQRVWSVLGLGPTIAGLLVWPGELNPMYGPRAIAGNQGPNLSAVSFVGALALVSWLAWRAAKRGDRRVACALAWVLVAFAPASNLLVPTGQILAERTLYLSSVGVAMLLGIGVEAVVARIEIGSVPVLRTLSTGAIIGVVLLAFVTARSTGRRTLAWKDHGALFQQAIQADPGDHRPHRHLAEYHLTLGDTSRALTAYARAFALAPEDRDVRAGYVGLLQKLGLRERLDAIGRK
jgi:hypothetical protein